jgi:uncharacterized damage-inducible protein DinB
MLMTTLEDAVHTFTLSALGLSDDDLDQPWAWQSYDSEGIRFAFFRAFEELLELAVRLRTKRAEMDLPLTPAQLILGQFHTAYLNLQHLLLGVNAELAALPPAEGEWSVRRTLAHIISADIGFYVAIKYALEQHRARAEGPSKIPDEAWESLSGLDEASYKALLDSPFDDLQSYHRTLHTSILEDFSNIKEQELDILSTYWEVEAMSVRFRMHRFTSHMSQHSIQIEKTLDVIGPPITEVNRLLKKVYLGFSEVGAALIGAWDVGEELRKETAGTLQQITEEMIKSRDVV